MARREEGIANPKPSSRLLLALGYQQEAVRRVA